MQADQWFSKGFYKRIDGHQLFVIDSQQWAPQATAQTKKPNLVILHGFPTSSYDYYKVIELLAKHYRVILHDHLGFGFSDKPTTADYSIFTQCDRSEQLWQQLGIKEAVFLAHDYGTSVLTELLARDNQDQATINIQGIIFCNGSVHIELAKLRPIQKLLRMKYIGSLIARLTSKQTLRRNLKAIYQHPEKLSSKEIESIWQLMRFNQGRHCLAAISRYTLERQTYWQRWIGALQTTDKAIEIVWPKEDPIAVSEMAEVILQETNRSRLHWIDDCGHFPMLERPQTWSGQVIDSMKYLLDL